MKKVLLILFISSVCGSCSNNAESKTEVKKETSDSGSKKIDSPKTTTEPAHGMIPPGDSTNGRRPRD